MLLVAMAIMMLVKNAIWVVAITEVGMVAQPIAKYPQAMAADGARTLLLPLQL